MPSPAEKAKRRERKAARRQARLDRRAAAMRAEQRRLNYQRQLLKKLGA